MAKEEELEKESKKEPVKKAFKGLGREGTIVLIIIVLIFTYLYAFGDYRISKITEEGEETVIEAPLGGKSELKPFLIFIAGCIVAYALFTGYNASQDKGPLHEDIAKDILRFAVKEKQDHSKEFPQGDITVQAPCTFREVEGFDSYWIILFSVKNDEGIETDWTAGIFATGEKKGMIKYYCPEEVGWTPKKSPDIKVVVPPDYLTFVEKYKKLRGKPYR